MTPTKTVTGIKRRKFDRKYYIIGWDSYNEPLYYGPFDTRSQANQCIDEHINNAASVVKWVRAF